ncbi:hypothetical protein HLH44_19110 [Gluconacetobacter sp. 1c LMG 22058]|uniref:Uncharacterized protein n=1 Tax=Gluconacetobacter dulcium TaxID=2729096 RepID=A0A7W4K3I7_9PROT|nr:hypothetical protein [Gluconacetobacter dulcium]MBB2199517.1 hypothetical protein [Gluconacetobacter dulcium]
MTDPDDFARAVHIMLDARGYRFETGIPGLETIPSWRISQPDMLLPVFLRLAEELWRQDTGGSGFGLHIVPDEISLTGHRLIGLFHVPAAIALLAIDAVLRRLADDHILTLDALADEAMRVAG